MNHPQYATPPIATWSTRLTAAFIVLFAFWLLYIRATPIPRPTFFSDPVHAVLILSAAVAAIAGGVAGVFGLAVVRARSIGLWVNVLVGAVVLYWTILELVGH